MPRNTVTALPDEEGTDATSPVLLDERIGSIHLGDDLAATQLIQRLAWAISDAEELEHAA